jgi:uncharacterized protein YheU (UPF0270 family)
MNAIEIPLTSLSNEAQQGVIDDFILREGTDYGAVEASLDRKQQDIRRQIESGKIKLVFDPETQTVTLLTEHEWRKLK